MSKVKSAFIYLFFELYAFILYRRGQIYPSGDWRKMVSGHKSKLKKMDLNYAGHKSKLKKMVLNYVRTQVKIEKDGFICPLRTHSRTNVRTRQDKNFNCVRIQVKIAKDGFYLCPDISQNRKI